MNKVYACLTTLPDRTKALEETVKSLLPQVDRLFIFLHGYNPTMLPDFLDNNPKIELAYDIEWGDNGDGDKFHFVKELEGYILICDDDLIYPSDYAKKMVEAIEKYERKALITAHGTIVYPLPIASYYLDRYTYPCLGDVFEETKVHIGGTGVMAFHSDIKFDLSFEDKVPNMADVHVGIWAGERDTPVYVIPHMAEWIKHSQYVSQENTISGKQFHNSFEQVDAINKRPDLFQSKFLKNKKKPKVTIVVINSRLKSNPHFVKECYDSLRAQSYPNIQVIVINNMDKLMTIGKCWNDAVKRAKGKYILFVGDDDFISRDYTATLLSLIENTDMANVIGVSSYLTMFHWVKGTDELVQEPRELIPTGMYLKSYLKKYPFKEYLTRNIDSEFMTKITENGKVYLVARHSYGYYYRSHPEQVSGFKGLEGAHAQVPTNSIMVNKRLKEIENEG